MARSAVEERLHALGAANSADPVLSELRNSTVLTVGETNAALESSAFQIKVPNPSGVSEDTPIANILVSAVVEAFKDDMDIRRPVKFAGLGVAASAGHSYRIDRPGLGEVIGRPTLDYPTDSAIGGVAIVVTDVEPPLAPADALERIRRMRSSPAFAEAGGRSVDVVGLDAAGNGTFKSLAIVVADPDLAGAQLSDVAWQKNYADLEWNLISSALSQQASLEQVSSISPSVARDLASQATLAVLLSCVGMLVYIWIRFGSLLYSVATVIGVVFNISVCLGMLAMSKWIGDTQFGHFLRVQDFRIDLNVVAALLVVIGYSLNDTIVILDRVRENRGKLAHASRSIINESLNQTFSRTLLTGGCTAATPIVLYLVGGPSMQPFAFTFFVGLVAGTFSSVAIAAPLVYVPGDGTPEPDGAASRALASPASA
jgi:SecD/SecF fusion protein